MISRETTAVVYFSNRFDGQAGYGDGVVHIRIPEERAELEDELR
jgi:hypothetical protein